MSDDFPASKDIVFMLCQLAYPVGENFGGGLDQIFREETCNEESSAEQEEKDME